MICDLTRAEIDRALPKVDKGLARYLWIQSRVSEGGAFSSDANFQKAFNGFYQVRRGESWRTAFYNMMPRAAAERWPFRTALLKLIQATNRHEASFASKLVATFDTSKPVIDRKVLDKLNLRLPWPGSNNRAENICGLYDRIAVMSTQFLVSDDGGYLVDQFVRMYPDANISREKMLDLVLWKAEK